MRKRLCILTLLFALLLLAWVVPASAEEITEIVETVYIEDAQFVEFSASAPALLSSDPETWEADWKEYRDQLDGYGADFYTALEDTFGDGLPKKVVLQDQYGNSYDCWNMTVAAMEEKTFKADTKEAAKELYQKWLADYDVFFQMELAATAFTYDHPEYFWLRQAFMTSTGAKIVTYSRGDNVVAVEYKASPAIYFIAQPMSDNAPADEITPLKKQLNDVVEELEAAVEALPDHKKVEYFDQWLAANVHYDCAALEAGEGLEKDETPWSVVGALLNGQAVCEGYAKALQLLCHESGIPCITISGKAWNSLPATGEGEDHMWTAVQLDGTWYFCDPTWNDPVINSTVEASTNDFSTKEYLLVAQPESHKAVEPFILPDLSGMPVEISVNLETGKLEGRETSTTQVKMFIALFDEHRRMIACGICIEEHENDSTVYTYYPPEFDAEDIQAADNIVRFVLTPDHIPDGETKDLLN